LDQSARVVDSPLQKRLVAGSIASNCSPFSHRQKIFDKMTGIGVAITDEMTIIRESGSDNRSRQTLTGDSQMAATFITTITDKMIQDRIDSVTFVTVETCSRSTSGLEAAQSEAEAKLENLTVAEVRKMLEMHDIAGISEVNEIDMGISLACEGSNWPEGFVVSVTA
jgi:hypothetical protein